VRITLLGSYSNGKTTLARKIAEKYCLTLIPEVARVILSEYETSLKELRKDVEQVNEFQKEVFLRQKSYEEQYKDNYVSSRGIDNIIFFAQYGNKLNELVESKEFRQSSQEIKQDLTRKVLGKYVYWLVDNTNKLEVMVDPIGQLPCFYYTFPNGDLLFSSNIDLINQL
jgi:hypothetical protein